MQIFVRTPLYETVTLQVEPSDTILTVKRKFKDKKGIPEDEQRLRHGVKLLLDEDLTLSDYGISKSVTLHLSLDYREWY